MIRAAAARALTMGGYAKMKSTPATSNRGPVTIQSPISLLSVRSEGGTVGHYCRGVGLSTAARQPVA